MKRLVSLLALALAGCAGTDRIVTQVQQVDKPVATSCVPADLPAPPAYPDTDVALKAATDAAARELLLYDGRKVRIHRLTLLEQLIGNCK